MTKQEINDFRVLKKLGAKLRNHRETAGLSQDGLANHSGLHRTYIGAVERGERNPSFLSLVKYAAGLKMTVAELIL